MTPEEKFNRDVWWILQEIKKDSYLTPKGQRVEFSLRSLPKTKSIRRKDVDYGFPQEEVQRKLLFKLQEWKALGDVKAVDNVLRGSDIFNPRIYDLTIKQPKFDELYKKYEASFSSQPTPPANKAKPRIKSKTSAKEKPKEPKTAIEFLQEIVRELYQQYSKYPAGKKIRYEVYLGEDDSEDENQINDYYSRLEALKQLKEEGIVLDYTIESKTEDIQHNEYVGTRIEYKIAKCLVDKNELQKHINDLSGSGDNAKSNGDLDYKQSLFLLKTFYSKILEILDAFAGGYIAVRNNVINHYYTVLNSLVDDTLNKKGFEELKNAKPELFESLIGDIEDFDVEWEFGSKRAYDFLGKIEKLYILSGSPVFSLPDEMKIFLQKADEAVSEHRKYCYEQWQKMEKRAQNYKEQWDKQWSKDDKTTETKQPETKSDTEKILTALDGAIVRGFENMFTKAPLQQQGVQKIEIVNGKLEVDGLKDGLKAIAQSKKETDKFKFPYKLPAGTKWEEITIKFVDDENVYIQVKQFKHTASFKELGLVGRGKNPNPSELWAFLKVLAQVNGELAIKDAQARDKYKKQKELLAKALQSYFSLDYDPFYPYRSSSEKQGNSYKIKITLIPLQSDDAKSTAAAEENDDLGVKEYLKEQAPQVNEE